MEIRGFFKEGMINSLLYEIALSDRDGFHTRTLLSEAIYPSNEIDIDIRDVIVLIQPNFHEYGGSDAVLLVDGGGGKTVVFVEGETIHGQESWRTSKEYKKFLSGKDRSNPKSKNPFVRLYHKTRFIRDLRTTEQHPDQECSYKLSSIRSQKIVRMVDEYAQNAIFLNIVPDGEAEVDDFMTNILRDGELSGIPGWDVGQWGFLPWERIHDHCKRNGLKNTLENFDFNEGSIY